MSKLKPTLLEPEVIKTLRAAAFPPILIEFFGKVSGMSYALNNSTNPVAAAKTMMKNPEMIKPKNKKSFAQMFRDFLHAKALRMEQTNAGPEIPRAIEDIMEDYAHVNSDMTEEDDPNESVTLANAADADE
jgi:hypothetical protein